MPYVRVNLLIWQENTICQKVVGMAGNEKMSTCQSTEYLWSISSIILLPTAPLLSQGISSDGPSLLGGHHM